MPAGFQFFRENSQSFLEDGKNKGFHPLAIFNGEGEIHEFVLSAYLGFQSSPPLHL